MSLPGFSFYDFCNPETGVVLYRTYATTAEILNANARLRESGIYSRFYPASTFNAPLLHDQN